MQLRTPPDMPMGAGSLVSTMKFGVLPSGEWLPKAIGCVRKLDRSAQDAALSMQVRALGSDASLASAAEEVSRAYQTRSAKEIGPLIQPFADSIGMPTSPIKPARPSLIAPVPKTGASGPRPSR